jgi:hypothetical protein
VTPTADSIRRILAEYDEIGRSEFLKRYSHGIGAKIFYLVSGDRLYDLKAVWAAAHDPPEKPGNFHTGAAKGGVEKLGLRWIDTEEASAYREGKRATRETNFFVRNRKLVADAKSFYGTKCMVCEFDFRTKYGQLGTGFIECHHKFELSANWERKTMIEDVAVLCANCHRMIHVSPNRMPTIEQLREIIEIARKGQ